MSLTYSVIGLMFLNTIVGIFLVSQLFDTEITILFWTSPYVYHLRFSNTVIYISLYISQSLRSVWSKRIYQSIKLSNRFLCNVMQEYSCENRRVAEGQAVIQLVRFFFCGWLFIAMLKMQAALLFYGTFSAKENFWSCKEGDTRQEQWTKHWLKCRKIHWRTFPISGQIPLHGVGALLIVEADPGFHRGAPTTKVEALNCYFGKIFPQTETALCSLEICGCYNHTVSWRGEQRWPPSTELALIKLINDVSLQSISDWLNREAHMLGCVAPLGNSFTYE